MLLHTLCLLLLLTSRRAVAAPIDRSTSLYRVIESTPIADSSPTCYRRWRHYGSHLTFRLARLHTCCSSDEQHQPPTAGALLPLHHTQHRLDFYPSSKWGVVPRGRRFSRAGRREATRG